MATSGPCGPATTGSAVYAIMLSLANTRLPRLSHTAMGLWNCGLAAFSVTGASVCVPAAIDIFRRGWMDALCHDPHIYGCGTVGRFIWLFVYSKLVELGDTVFLVCTGRNVSLLHAFHHTTVLLFC